MITNPLRFARLRLPLLRYVQTLHLMTLAVLVLASLASPARAQSFDNVVQLDVLPGWRNNDGSHTAALRISLNPGWKTYWRAPGDAGIPPQISWQGSRNVADITVVWPTPTVFNQNGMRSIGYTDSLILPVVIKPKKTGSPVRLKAVLDIGVCRDICVPQTLRVKAKLPDVGARDARISAALVDQPLTASEAGVVGVTCAMRPIKDGISLTAQIQMPTAGADEIVVIETGNPELWVAEAASQRQSGTLVATTELMHVQDLPFMLDRSALRFTVLGNHHAVDIIGCSS